MKEFFKKKIVKITAVILALALLVPLILDIGTKISSGWRAWRPDYEREDISGILEKENLSDDDYAFLYKQTGLTKIGIDGLIDGGLKSRIYKIQNQFFAEQEYELRIFAPFTGFMKRDPDIGVATSCLLEDGDILYSPTTFFSFIKLGHTAVIMDSSNAALAQVSGYGSCSTGLSTSTFFVRPAFVVLRANADREVREDVAKYVSDELMGIDYNIFAGIFEKKHRRI